MPTGYTSRIADGISFEDFIMNCAKAFGALVSMRDEPADAQIPKEFKPSDYHKNALKKIEKELAEIKTMPNREAKKIATDKYQTLLNAKEEGIREANKLAQQYGEMLIKVKRWLPPTPDHQELKDFMIQQITDSIKFDCGTSYYENQQIPLLSGQEWKTKRIQQLQKDLVYHTKENLAEIERVAGRNDWVQKLRESLKAKN